MGFQEVSRQENTKVIVDTITKALKGEVVLKVKREGVEDVAGVVGVVVEGVEEGAGRELLLCLLLLWLLGGHPDQPAAIGFAPLGLVS